VEKTRPVDPRSAVKKKDCSSINFRRGDRAQTKTFQRSLGGGENDEGVLPLFFRCTDSCAKKRPPFKGS